MVEQSKALTQLLGQAGIIIGTVPGFKLECLRCKSVVCTFEIADGTAYFTCTMCEASTVVGK